MIPFFWTLIAAGALAGTAWLLLTLPPPSTKNSGREVEASGRTTHQEVTR